MHSDERELQIEEVVQPVLRDHGLTLVDLEWRGPRPRGMLRVFVDKTGGVRVEDCQRVSRELGDVLDAAGLIEEAYDLEVSSPGLDRQLRKDRELRWAAGRAVRVWMREPVDDRRELTGRLVLADGGALALDTTEGLRRVPRSLVTKVRLEVEPRGSA